MTLTEIVKTLLDIAKNQPNINYVGEGDIYNLNSTPNVDYSVVYITQGTHNLDKDTVTYSFYLYYIDRLTGNNDNTLNIQSTGIRMLGNIINIFNEVVDEAEIVYDIQFQPFTHRFADDCAGVYATIQIEVGNNIGLCGYM